MGHRSPQARLSKSAPLSGGESADIMISSADQIANINTLADNDPIPL
ncbi:MAG: hypothetical protein ACPG8W_26220 [Candidatus Promineifilaceae bacterium]